MIVLARKIGEAAFIGNRAQIQVWVMPANNDYEVRLAIQSPSHLPVDRAEVFLRRNAHHKHELWWQDLADDVALNGNFPMSDLQIDRYPHGR